MNFRYFQPTAGAARVDDFGPSAVLDGRDEGLYRLDVDVLGADLEARAGITIPHALADARRLGVGELDTVEAQPGEILDVGEYRLQKHVLHLDLLRAVGDDEAVRLDEAQVAELEALRYVSHRSLGVLEADPPEVDPQRLQTPEVRRQRTEEALEDLVVDEEQGAAAAADLRLVEGQVELAQGGETGEEGQQQRSAESRPVVHCHLRTEIWKIFMTRW